MSRTRTKKREDLQEDFNTMLRTYLASESDESIDKVSDPDKPKKK